MLFSSLKGSNIRGLAVELLAKFWMMIASVVITINLFIVLTLLQMAPKLHVLAQILTTPMSSQELVQTDPFSGSIGDKKLIDETLVRYYLDMRLSEFHDKDEMARRWQPGGPVFLLSSSPVYQRFAQNLKEKLTATNAANGNKSVDVVSVSRLDNTFTVEFDVYSYFRGTMQVQRRVAIIEVAYNPYRRYFRTTGANPYGMFIKTYNESIKKQ